MLNPAAVAKIASETAVVNRLSTWIIAMVTRRRAARTVKDQPLDPSHGHPAQENALPSGLERLLDGANCVLLREPLSGVLGVHREDRAECSNERRR